MVLDPTPRVSAAYGAPMGRSVGHPGDEIVGRANLRRIRLDRGGYDPGGAYWGLGPPLWWVCGPDGEGEAFFRAADRETAKAHVVSRHPGATFYR